MSYPATSTDLDPLLTPSSLLKFWSHADTLEARNRSLRGTRIVSASKGVRRGVPFYKVMHGMPLAVDAFRFGPIPGCVGYFLSHAHSDHYIGLGPNWNAGPVYCTQTSVNLLATSLRVPQAFLHPLPLNQEFEVPGSGGVKVTLLPANHCPGSCVFLFRGPHTAYILPNPPPSCGIPPPAPLPFIDTRTGREKEWLYLHCGDFRASPYLLEHPRIKNKHLDIIYLDTTYLNPRYCFPAQEEVVQQCGECVYRMLSTDEERAQADQRRKTWEQEGITPEEWKVGSNWQTVKKDEDKKRKWQEERKGMQGWLGIKGEDDGDDDKSDLAGDRPKKVKVGLGSLAKGLFRYADEPEDAVKLEDIKAEQPDDEDEEAAWAEAHTDVSKCLGSGGEAIVDENYEEPIPATDDAEDDDGGTATPAEGDEAGTADDYGLGEMDESQFNLEDDELADLDGLAAQDGSYEEATTEQSVKEEPTDDDKNGIAPSRRDDKKAIQSMLAQPTLPFLSKTESNGSPSGSSGRVLILCGTYSIGKEKIALSCALRLGSKIYCCDNRKFQIFSQLEDEPLLQALITRDPAKAQVHVTNLFALNFESISGHLKELQRRGCNYSRVIAFRPTGWSYRPRPGDVLTQDASGKDVSRLIQSNLAKIPGNERCYSWKDTYNPTRDSTPTIQIIPIPYSEHSSFLELSCFVLGLHSWGRIVPTVNVGNPRSRKKMQDWITKWREERLRRKREGIASGVQNIARTMDYF